MRGMLKQWIPSDDEQGDDKVENRTTQRTRCTSCGGCCKSGRRSDGYASLLPNPNFNFTSWHFIRPPRCDGISNLLGPCMRADSDMENVNGASIIEIYEISRVKQPVDRSPTGSQLERESAFGMMKIALARAPLCMGFVPSEPRRKRVQVPQLSPLSTTICSPRCLRRPSWRIARFATVVSSC